MKVKLKLDREELKGLITICSIFGKKYIVKSVIDFLIYGELTVMGRRYSEKLISPSKSFSIALTDFQTVILFEMLNECADNFMPFEKSLALKIIAEIDRQYLNHRHMLLNFMQYDEQKQLN